VLAGALADATKVDSQRRQTGFVQGGSGAEHDFVVHRAAAKWMRMQHQGHALRMRRARFFQNRFQPPMLNGKKKVSCRIHKSGQTDSMANQLAGRFLIANLLFVKREARALTRHS
jgi:hypothetical protein